MRAARRHKYVISFRVRAEDAVPSTGIPGPVRSDKMLANQHIYHAAHDRWSRSKRFSAATLLPRLYQRMCGDNPLSLRDAMVDFLGNHLLNRHII
jgi:hypothetical protein